MKLIDLNHGSHVRFLLFPDNQPHLVIEGIEAGDEVKVVCAITDSLKMMHLLQASNALAHLGAKKKLLVIPYLMAARYDRLMQPGDSFDLEVVAGLINSCGFEKVYLWDAHSSVATSLIMRSVSIKNKSLVTQYDKPGAVVICPDKGATQKVNEYLEWNKHLTDIVYCDKKRNLATGQLVLEVKEPQKCTDRHCVIIDDICDGGATFLAIAEQVQPKTLTLIVTHGIFSKGFVALEQRFNEILVSDSYARSYNSSIVRVVPAIIEEQ